MLYYDVQIHYFTAKLIIIVRLKLDIVLFDPMLWFWN